MAYIPPLNGGRLNASIGGNSTSAGAGYALASTGTLLLAGGNNITLSQNANSITISGANTPTGSINFSASNTSASLASVTFSNSNGVSFGLNAGVITASHNGITSQTNQILSLLADTNGNTFGQSSSSTFNATNLPFKAFGSLSVGFSGSSVVLSGSQSAQTQSNIQALVGGTVANTASTGTVTFSNSNGITFGMTNNVMTASHNGITSQSNQAIGFTANSTGVYNTTYTSTGSFDARNLIINGMGAAYVGMSNSSIMISVPTQTVGNQSIGIGGTAGGSSATAGSVSVTGGQLRYNFYAGSNITLSQSANGASGSLSIYGGAGGAGGGIALSASNALISSGTASIAAGGALTASVNGQTLSLNAPAVSQLTYTGAVSMSSNGSTISIGAPVVSLGMSTTTAGGGTGGTSGSVSNGLQLVAGSNITLSQSTNSNGATVSIYGTSGGGGGNGVAIVTSNTTYSSGSLQLSNAGGALTIATAAGPQLNFSVPATSSLVGANGISVSTNGSTISVGLSNVYNSTVFGKQHAWATNTLSFAQTSLYIFPEVVHQQVSGSIIKLPVFITNSSSAFAAHTRGHTLSFAVYSRNATNSTVLTQMYSTSYTAAMSANSNGTWAISAITGLGNSTSYNSITASSAGLNLSASIHGSREFLIAFATNLAPGEYWFAINNSSSSAGAAGNIFNLAFPIFSSSSGNALGVSQGSSSKGLAQNIGHGVYSAGTGAMPSGISMTQINALGVNPTLYFLNDTA
jgi:hypothetical protein